ncbi:MAG: bifunctional DNA-formamidopyrimidine glycosylase/DNA-(apurinic or apyrimidinic site) lyase [Syntrophomonas sp.]|uniref:bifunctional DNA-formamidopyrimidine glycosylase/DNA-(apurinic or apyrimidinic site) lyase n=1 Tax=Syntrophomonas sp. TaxID=2053627 RepID=UPI002610A496|nr:bifunctional DNA-formamidopyrimidine glycosylase/DNA-(apurinic or apyrimidinic site) lyase [Syntrophomonas sp.]MDD2509881.1 bifunctional DNA-formamidopyrimidine glycosylase/DNA-(apurinic or apyrimidinic site) lyase [Syntrophomonas sp.]MDD4626201.1 bifunctional DNA-formamidopyrimidine glycosylase/DNA-(apurinic or apyrimidinic site) lyase [Syntrophomonas sp.]
MPELPEVETIKNNLQEILPLRIKELELRREDILRSRDYALKELAGQSIEEVSRRGKYLILAVDNGLFLVFHLGMSGRLYIQEEELTLLEPHVHVIIHLDKPFKLLYQDARRFGGLWLLKDIDSFFSRLGKEPLSEEFSPRYLAQILKGRQTAIKNLLLNQSLISGLGNIYADEALFIAGIRPDRKADSLSLREIEGLCCGIKEVLAKSIKYRGTTFRDYRDGRRQPGEFQKHLQVYGRFNQACPTCGQPLKRSRIGGRSSHYCDKCQQ